MIKKLLPFLFIFVSCEKAFFDIQESNDIHHNFEVFWTEFDRHYSYFDLKNIDWDSVYNSNTDRMLNGNENDLYEFFRESVNLLYDGHVNVMTPQGFISYSEWKNINPLNLTMNTGRYINNKNVSGSIYYTYVTGRNIGYIHIPSFGGIDENLFDMDDILDNFKNSSSIIIDVRSNGGGSDRNAKKVAGRFIDEKRMYRKVRYRNGPDHGDFTEWIEAEIEPEGNWQYLNPVVILTNRGCFSATEGFVLKMKDMPHVTIIGDTTGGGSGNPIFKELPNGWSFRLSNWQVVTADEEFYEGIGLVPDIPVQFSKSDSINGFDVMMERAIEFLSEK